MKHTLTITALIFLIASCVSPRKFRELEEDRSQLERRNRELTDQIASLEVGQRAAREDKSLLDETTRQLNSITARFQQLQRDYDLLSRRYDQILNQNQETLSVSSFEKSTLEARLAEKERELDRQERELRGLENSLRSRQNNVQAVQQELETARRQMDARERDLEELRVELAQRSARVDELERLLRANQQQMQLLRSQINEAVRGFRAEDLQVTERNGKIYVSLNQNLLFAKGSAALQSEGTRALSQLSTVLRNQRDLDILVEGHTDPDGTAAYNWELSAERAITVAKILINNGLDPQRVIPAGRAFYQPIAPNDTPANKQRNRRVELVLSPRLDRLFELAR